MSLARAGGWPPLGLGAVLLLPWYKMPPEGPAAAFPSALGHALAGRGWLWPVVLAMVALAALVWRGRPPVRLAAGGLVLMLAAAFLVSLNGPAFSWVAELFPAAQTG
ncbi:MAG: hypothetical protein KDJ78_17735, partial [Rhodobacteraceae bacterium]|nr:hypothetical protein [Paracoccaceae bacterium]